MGLVSLYFCAPPCRILNAYASLLADQGQVDEAVAMFNKSIAVDANYSHVPHLYLGQVLDGEASLAHMRTGVGILDTAERASDQPAAGARQASARHHGKGKSKDKGPEGDRGRLEAKTIKAALCSARCALGEALLVCDDTGGADDEAEALFRAAVLACPDTPDAHQGLASLRLSQGKGEEAGAYMQSVLRILSETPLECLPSIDFRLQSAKLLIGKSHA